MRVISIVSGKGGVGKTTTAAGLGALLASEFKKKVLIVDCNITTAHLGHYMGIDHHPITLNHVLNGEAELKDAIYEHFTGAKVLPSSLALKDLQGIDVIKMKNVVGKIKKDMKELDIVLLDCAPGLGREATAAMRASDEVLYVTTPYIPCIIDTLKCAQLAPEFGLKSVGLIVNMQKKDKHELSVRDIENLTELDVIGTIPLHHDAFKSLHARIPITAYLPKSKVSRAYRNVAASIAGVEYEPSGFFVRLLRLFD